MIPPRAVLAIAQVAVVACLIGRIIGLRVPERLSWGAVILALTVSGWVMIGEPNFGIDAKIFWNAGSDIWAGRDPYARSEVLNPPTALPFFALMALFPISEFLTIWKMMCLGSYAILAPACYAAVPTNFEAASGETLTLVDLGLLSGVLMASVAVRFGIVLGQNPVVISLAVIGAIACRARNKPIGAGLSLVLTSIKPTTMIPVLLLFPPWKQIKVWVVLAIGGLLLSSVAVRPTDLLSTLDENLKNIQNAGLAGAVNDYSFNGPNTVDLLGLQYAIYHLGFRDRNYVAAMHLATLAALGIFLVWQIYRRTPLGLRPSAAIVACYSAIFIYHRQYDSVILVIPLVYAYSRCLVDIGWRRRGYQACVLGILCVLYEPLNLIHLMYPIAQGPGALNRLVEACVLPLGTWIIVAISLLLASLERQKVSAEPVSMAVQSFA